MKLWILLFCVFLAGVSAQSEDDGVPDYWEQDYNEQWYQEQLKKLDGDDDIEEDSNNFNDYDNIANVGNQEKNQDEMDKKVDEEIQEFQEKIDENDAINDYQYEDNRSEQKVGDDEEVDEKAQPIRDDDDANNANDEYDDYGINEADLPPALDIDEKEVQVSKDDDIVPLPMPPQSSDEIKQIMEETRAILDEEEEKPNDFAEDDAKEDQNIDDEIDDIMEETKNILDNTDTKFDEESDKIEPIENPVEEAPEDDASVNINADNEKKIDENLSDNIVSADEDTLNKVYEDLNEDLNSLFETLNKLAKSDDEDDKVESADVDYAVNYDDSLDEKAEYENVFDSNLSDLFAEHSKLSEEKDADNVDEDDNDPILAEKHKEANDELDDDEQAVLDDEMNDEDNENKELIKSVSVDQLTDDQFDQLMKDFEVQHSDAFDAVPNVDHIVNEIKLEYGETKVITTENYPAGYPTNRIVDWIVTGEGVGIEFNVTDFAVNSGLGDYLLVKPGQSDDSGPDGLLFAYHLNEPRAYRFTDVDKLFLRFDAKNGFSFLRGFSLTVKMIAPIPSDPEPEPEPEAVLPEPHSTLSIMLGGVTLQEFKEIEENFRLLIADMATMYINANRIQPGLNTTSQTTQIISASVCNVHWPGFEQCAHVRVAVPLVYEDEDEEERLNEQDLQSMWETYVDQDPFATRLRQMGVEEFSVPNDGGVLTVWLVVALGVLVSAAMLALALWRYSCFDNYSRMPAFSDVDSINEKRGLDLYPTPHQTLPPLYSESEYKWEQHDDSARVDMGGYANRSYTRTDIYDLDSDEDVVLPRDSSAGIQPRDVYSV